MFNLKWLANQIHAKVSISIRELPKIWCYFIAEFDVRPGLKKISLDSCQM